MTILTTLEFSSAIATALKQATDLQHVIDWMDEPGITDDATQLRDTLESIMDYHLYATDTANNFWNK